MNFFDLFSPWSGSGVSGGLHVASQAAGVAGEPLRAPLQNGSRLLSKPPPSHALLDHQPPKAPKTAQIRAHSELREEVDYIFKNNLQPTPTFAERWLDGWRKLAPERAEELRRKENDKQRREERQRLEALAKEAELERRAAARRKEKAEAAEVERRRNHEYSTKVVDNARGLTQKELDRLGPTRAQMAREAQERQNPTYVQWGSGGGQLYIKRTDLNNRETQIRRMANKILQAHVKKQAAERDAKIAEQMRLAQMANRARDARIAQGREKDIQDQARGMARALLEERNKGTRRTAGRSRR